MQPVAPGENVDENVMIRIVMSFALNENLELEIIQTLEEKFSYQQRIMLTRLVEPIHGLLLCFHLCFPI